MLVEVKIRRKNQICSSNYLLITLQEQCLIRIAFIYNKCIVLCVCVCVCSNRGLKLISFGGFKQLFEETFCPTCEVYKIPWF